MTSNKASDKTSDKASEVLDPTDEMPQTDKDIICAALCESPEWINKMTTKGRIVWIICRDQNPREHLKSKMSPTGPHRPTLFILSVTEGSEHVKGKDADIELLRKCLKRSKPLQDDEYELLLPDIDVTLNIADLNPGSTQGISVDMSSWILPKDDKDGVDGINSAEADFSFRTSESDGKYVVKCDEKNVSWTLIAKTGGLPKSSGPAAAHAPDMKSVA